VDQFIAMGTPETVEVTNASCVSGDPKPTIFSKVGQYLSHAHLFDTKGREWFRMSLSHADLLYRLIPA
jgi:hypothetical protein